MKFLAVIIFLWGTSSSAESLRILNWSEYIDLDLLDEYSEKNGVKIEYDTYANSEAVESKLIAGGAGYDLVVVSSEYLGRLISSNAITTFDSSKLTNIANLWDEIMDRVADLDPQGKHAIPYLWGTTGLGYDRNKILERMPDAPLNSWSLIFDPEIVANFADCGISVVDTPEEVLSIALVYLGYDPNSLDHDEIAAAQDAIGEIMPFVASVDTDQFDHLSTGDACLSLVWSGEALAAADDAIDNIEITYVIPKEGAPIWFDLFVIPSDALNTDQVHRFLDYMLLPEVIARSTNLLWYPNANSAATELVDQQILDDPAIYPPQDILDRLFAIHSRSPAEKQAIARVWRRFRLGI